MALPWEKEVAVLVVAQVKKVQAKHHQEKEEEVRVVHHHRIKMIQKVRLHRLDLLLQQIVPRSPKAETIQTTKMRTVIIPLKYLESHLALVQKQHQVHLRVMG